MIIRYMKRNWLDLIIGGFVMVLFYNVLHGLITKDFPLSDFILLITSIFLLFIIGFFVNRFQKGKTVCFVDKDFKTHRKGVIFTLGISSHLPTSPQMKVINAFKPELLGLITTGEIETHRQVADNIVSSLNLKIDHYKKKEVDPTNIKEIKESVSHILEWMRKRFSNNEIVVDITGGTAVMSCGAFEAAKEYGVDIQYIFSDYDYEKNKVKPDTQKALIVHSQRVK